MYTGKEKCPCAPYRVASTSFRCVPAGQVCGEALGQLSASGPRAVWNTVGGFLGRLRFHDRWRDPDRLLDSCWQGKHAASPSLAVDSGPRTEFSVRIMGRQGAGLVQLSARPLHDKLFCDESSSAELASEGTERTLSSVL